MLEITELNQHVGDYRVESTLGVFYYLWLQGVITPWAPPLGLKYNPNCLSLLIAVGVSISGC